MEMTSCLRRRSSARTASGWIRRAGRAFPLCSAWLASGPHREASPTASWTSSAHHSKNDGGCRGTLLRSVAGTIFAWRATRSKRNMRRLNSLTTRIYRRTWSLHHIAAGGEHTQMRATVDASWTAARSMGGLAGSLAFSMAGGEQTKIANSTSGRRCPTVSKRDGISTEIVGGEGELAPTRNSRTFLPSFSRSAIPSVSRPESWRTMPLAGTGPGIIAALRAHRTAAS
mmetsp:Transcript_66008/g.154454  ORF Transcript_66008/g.154454 Transcript_66008/m.154454 type:complete len:228 (-) Transcript_66008:6380-7063(-)